MKHRYTKLLPAVFAAGIIFTGCAAQHTFSIVDANAASRAAAARESVSTDEQAEDSPAESIGTSVSDSTIQSVGTQKTVGEYDMPADNNDMEAAGETGSSELFSERDLSGEYDSSEAVSILLNGTGASSSSEGVEISGSDITITQAGTYILSGTLENGSVIVDVSKEDKVQLVLKGVKINSDTFAAIYIRQADKVFVTLAEGTENSLANGGTFTQIDDNDVDAVVYARDDITLNGKGTLSISSPAGHGISGRDEVTITGGTYEIDAANCAVRARDSLAISDGFFTLTAVNDGLHAENGDDDTLGNIYITGGSFDIQVSDDAIHANTLLQIDGGNYEISAAEGLEGTYIKINDGTILINAADDGVNAAYKSSSYTPAFEINGGTLTIIMGQGDTDGVDSNADLVINGGTIDITGQSAFDYDGTAQYNGGTIIVNGQTLNSVPNQMMGGGMSGGKGGMRGGMYGRPF